jgi:hypothetical protein
MNRSPGATDQKQAIAKARSREFLLDRARFCSLARRTASPPDSPARGTLVQGNDDHNVITCEREDPALKPEITLIKKSGLNPVMSKRIFLDEQGKVCSDGSQCLMAQGTATRATAETAAGLAKHIMACRSGQAIALGALRADLPRFSDNCHPREARQHFWAVPSGKRCDARANQTMVQKPIRPMSGCKHLEFIYD